MNEQIEAAVFVNETNNTVQIELSNFENKILALEAASLIIMALGIKKVKPFDDFDPGNNTIH